MDVSAIKEYLCMTIDTEQNITAQKNTLNTFQLIKNKIHDDNQNLKKHISNIKAPKSTYKGKSFLSLILFFLAFSVIASIVFGIIVVLLYVLIWFVLPIDHVWREYYLLYSSCGVIIILLIVTIIVSIICSLKRKTRFQNNDKVKYNEYLNEINAKHLLVTSNEYKIDYLSNQINILTDLVSHSEKTLRMLYDCDFIHQKYKSLVYYVLIFECLDTGRCDKLEGPDGAYNRVELDYRLDEISNKIDVVISRLGDVANILHNMHNELTHLSASIDEVNNNLKQLHIDMNSMNYKMSNIGDELKKIEINNANANKTLKELESKSELSLYKQERTAREIEYANKINYYQRIGTSSILNEQRPPHMD